MSLPTNPYPLGKILPGATFATVAVQAIAALKAAGYLGGPTGAPSEARCGDLVIQAASTNSATIFITNNALPPAADYSNVIREVSPGGWYSAASYPASNKVDAQIYYVSAQNATDFGFGEVREG